MNVDDKSQTTATWMTVPAKDSSTPFQTANLNVCIVTVPFSEGYWD